MMSSSTKARGSSRYVFRIPLWNSRSNGIQILWLFAEILSKIRQVVIIPYYDNDESAQIPADMSNLVDLNYQVTKLDIVIYPDCITDNPLQASKVCRYILARPFMLNREWVHYQPNDFVFYYSKAVGDSDNQLNLISESMLTFLDDGTEVQREGDIVSIYYGKIRPNLDHAIVKQVVKKFKNIEIITRRCPGSKSELYNIIQRSSLLISLDPLSNMAYEATLLGTPVYFADDVFEEEYKNYNFPLLGFLDKDEVANFNPDEFDHNALKSKSQAIMQENILLNKNKVNDILFKIEEHFQNEETTDIDKIIELDEHFINNRWGNAPIVNGSSFMSIVAYHTVRKSIFLYWLAKKSYFVLRRVFKFFRLFSILNVKIFAKRILGLENDQYYSAFKKKNKLKKVWHPYKERKDFENETDNTWQKIKAEKVHGSLHFSDFQKKVIRKIWKLF